MTLFPEFDRPRAPLAERVRPRRISEVIGHAAVLGPQGWLARAVAAGEVPHLVLWGPPGVGKTTIARALAEDMTAEFVSASAVDIGVADVRRVVGDAVDRWRRRQIRTVFFLDEIHRFNKAQQDALLKDAEAGTLTVVGATTENPAFALTPALLSRLHVLPLAPLGVDEVAAILRRAIGHAEGLPQGATAEAVARIAELAGGDGRYALNLLELAATVAGDRPATVADVESTVSSGRLRHDKTGDLHYDVVSAWIKTMRGSDVDAALYWAARLWESGEDRRFLFRRLIIFASEDVGMADARALPLAVAAADAYERVGEAEGWIPFAHAVTYLTAAPKSKSAYNAYSAAREFITQHGDASVPEHLRNAPTRLARELGHGFGYVDPHARPGGTAPDVCYLPAGVPEDVWYRPTAIGDEAETRRRVEAFRAARRRARGPRDDE